MKHIYDVEGMHCESCVTKIERALKSIDGISGATVTLEPPQAVVEMNKHASIEVLNAAVKSKGAYSLKEKALVNTNNVVAPDLKESLLPLFVIVAYIIGGVLIRAEISNVYVLHVLMENFMGAFFIVFSLFKMIDLGGFADGYSTYDVLAKRSRHYALAYPFIELGLGILYFTGAAPLITNFTTVILMSVGSIGVIKALLEKRSIQCACLGTALKLPMTKVTLLEDVGMGLMAVFMLLGASS